ncbi:MAG: PIN domain-containing protein [Gemmatimonadetes bacterium]|nr:PIN domain-containing protein [Gemmatimonadota bacterium]
MNVAIVDSSCVVAIALGERGAAKLGERLSAFDQLYASALLDAEVRSALQREKIPHEGVELLDFQWISPSRPLTEEIQRVLEVGYVRGADCWHLACALYLVSDPRGVTFLTLDTQQRNVAKMLGFSV